MPRTAITPQPATGAGLVPTYEPANASGNSFRPAPGRCLHVRNSSASAITVSIPSTFSLEGLAMPNRAVAVAAGVETLIALGGQALAHRQSDQSVNVDYSATASVTVAVVDTP